MCAVSEMFNKKYTQSIAFLFSALEQYCVKGSICSAWNFNDRKKNRGQTYTLSYHQSVSDRYDIDRQGMPYVDQKLEKL